MQEIAPTSENMVFLVLFRGAEIPIGNRHSMQACCRLTWYKIELFFVITENFSHKRNIFRVGYSLPSPNFLGVCAVIRCYLPTRETRVATTFTSLSTSSDLHVFENRKRRNRETTRDVPKIGNISAVPWNFSMRFSTFVTAWHPLEFIRRMSDDGGTL
jgi:hypothetical protein